MYGYIGWNQLTPAQQQKVPAEYKNREVPLSVIQQNKIEITEMQKSVFNGTYSQRDETTYKVSDSGSGTKTSKFADFCKKAFAGAGAGVIAGLLASIIFPVGGAIACGIIAGGAAYLYASKKCKEANQKAAQQAPQQTMPQIGQQSINPSVETPETKTTEAKDTKTSESITGTSAADKKAAAKAAQAKNGVTREVQAMWEDAYKTALEEAQKSGDSAKIKKAQADLDKFYRNNPGYVSSKNGSGAQPKTNAETKQNPATSTNTTNKNTSESQSKINTETKQNPTTGTGAAEQKAAQDKNSETKETSASAQEETTVQERAARVANPKSGSALAMKKATLEQMQDVVAKGGVHGYKPSQTDINLIQKDIEDIVSGAKEKEIRDKISQLEKETADYGEVGRFEFSKKSKLKELEILRMQLDNLY